ncbi:MAG: CHAT domain-containing protein [Paracoccaceae bacterium]|nr:CHAT domain-containing protein [Paracoccaceae bacterium]
MRTITLELLRHGPANNQLLSPLTQYLALCENHGAVTVQVPFEHNQFLHRLSALSYRYGADPRSFYLHDTARVLSDLLSNIPGLTAEINRDTGIKDRFTHLRLIVSSSELALLPFELALSPNGFPGAGQSALLQSQTPICITREIRRVPELNDGTPRSPKILFVAAAPPGQQEIPLQAHLLALRGALDPWVRQTDTNRDLDNHIVLLPQATAPQVEAACAAHDFTHIHILAHGIQYQEGYDVRFGLALHHPRNPDGPAEVVSGARLATILRPTQQPDVTDLSRPSVVTLASCNSGAQGSVGGAGASIAHALHDAGIPIVVASQFPLSFEGSVRMVETLYHGFLWGEDPRALLIDLRRKLHSQFPQNHDWASLTAYASLPTTLAQDLATLKLAQASRSIEVAMALADKLTGGIYAATLQISNPDITDNGPSKEDAMRRIEFAKAKLASLLDSTSAPSAQIYGLLASTEKRQAELVAAKIVLETSTNVYELASGEHLQGKDRTVGLLRTSRDNYLRAYQIDRANSWGMVQHLSLVVILSRLSYKDTDEARLYDYKETDLWQLAYAISHRDRNSSDDQKFACAMANLIELYLLSLAMGNWDGKPTPSDAKKEALSCAHGLVNRIGAHKFTIYSTRRQMARYAEWYPKIAELGIVEDVAEALVRALPSTWEESFGTEDF